MLLHFPACPQVFLDKVRHRMFFVFTKMEIQTKSRHFNKKRKHENRLKSKGLQTGCKYAILARKGLTFCQ